MFTPQPAAHASLNRRKPLFGVGINDAPYQVTHTDALGVRHSCPYYTTWAGVLDRCFNPLRHKKRPTYAGCTLEESWKVFSNFKAWMDTQNWQGKVIDKDLLGWHNKHYGPATCLFITPALNNLLVLRTNGRGELPLGVSRTKIKGYDYFIASCSFYGRQKRLGYFKTPEEAAAAYQEAKLNYIAELAAAEPDPRIKQALLNLF